MHFKHYKDIPSFDGLLTHGHEAVTTVPKENDQSLVGLRLKGGTAFLLSTPDELNKVAWFALRERLKEKGYPLSGHATCSKEIISMLLHDINKLSREAARQIVQDAAVVNAIVNESIPISWFKDLLMSAMRIGASDIHFEFRGPRSMVRVRIDGVMRDFSAVPRQVAMDAVSAIYNIIAEERSRSEGAFNAALAQQAMIQIGVAAEQVNLRFQSHPAVEGLDVVIRVLRINSATRSQQLQLDRLGYTNSQVDALNVALGSAWGGIFVAGITGSGKTTTLNTLLTQLAKQGDRKILSIEDPVEYQVDGVSHLSIQRSFHEEDTINPFKSAMMAFLRMDPDIGMFGEIRDRLSAEMALSAIQTGHKILTTVHATSALGVIGRLTSKSLGLLRENVCTSEFISTLVYQVLTPVNCPYCKVRARDVMPQSDLAEYEKFFGLNVHNIFSASDTGCAHCLKPGIDYSRSKRIGIKGVKVHAEVITPDEEMYLKLNTGKDIEARRIWRSKRTATFDNPDMVGKEAWGHALYDLSQGLIDPYYFEMNFGSPKLFASLVKG